MKPPNEQESWKAYWEVHTLLKLLSNFVQCEPSGDSVEKDGNLFIHCDPPMGVSQPRLAVKGGYQVTKCPASKPKVLLNAMNIPHLKLMNPSMSVLWLEYFSNIPQTSSRTPDVQLCAMDAAFCIIGHLAPNSAECSDVFPFCYDSNISLIYCGHPVGLRTSDSAQWPRRFCIIRQLVPNSAECSDVSFHNISPFLFPDLFS